MPKEKFQAGQLLTTDLMDKFMQQSQVLQSTGNSESDVMSQNAVTAQLNLKANCGEVVSSSKINLEPLPNQSIITYEQIKSLKVGAYSTGQYGVEGLPYEWITIFVTNDGNDRTVIAQTQALSRMFFLSFNSGTPKGWQEVYTALNKPLPTYIGALPASGGTMQGGILFSNGGQVFKGNLQVNGAWRAYAGKTDGSKGGCFEIATAGKGNEPVYVRQYLDDFKYVNHGVTLLDEDGKSNFQYLQENYKRVYSENYFPTYAYIKEQYLPQEGRGYVKFRNGLMIVWDHGDAAPNAWITFVGAFGCAPIVVTAETHQDGSHNNLNVTGVTTTGFTVRKGNWDDRCYYNYVAIGYW